MTDDIVERLREFMRSDTNEAADEVVRLRVENAKLCDRIRESNSLLHVILNHETLPERCRPSVIEQLEDNRKALGDD